MTTEFDDQLKERVLAFQKHHGLTGDGVAGVQTWNTLVQSVYGAPSATVATQATNQVTAGAALVGVPVAATKPLTPREPMTQEQLQAIWQQSKTAEEFKLRVFGLRAVSDEELNTFLLANECIKPADHPDNSYAGPAIDRTPKGQEVVGRWIYSPGENGFTKKWVAGTKAQLDQLQRDENDRATREGAEGIAGALAGAAAGRGQGQPPKNTPGEPQATGRAPVSKVETMPKRPPVPTVPGPKPAATTAPPKPAATTGPPMPAATTPPPAVNPTPPQPTPAVAPGTISPSASDATSGPPKPTAAGPPPKQAGKSPKKPRVRNSDLPDFVPEPPPPVKPPAGGPAAAGMTARELAAHVKAARDYYPGHGGEVGALLVAGQEPMYVKSGEHGGPWGGTHRGGLPRGQGEAYTSGKAHEKNIASHVEGHSAAIMREQGITRATLIMGADQCQICAHNLPTVLPPNTTLELVHVNPNGQVNTNTYSSSSNR